MKHPMLTREPVEAAMAASAFGGDSICEDGQPCTHTDCYYRLILRAFLNAQDRIALERLIAPIIEEMESRNPERIIARAVIDAILPRA